LQGLGILLARIGVAMAAVTMSVLPMLVVFVLLQKHLVKGIQLGGVKG
jgi:ABC-type glycerol-3-phosphate transport system permease component